MGSRKTTTRHDSDSHTNVPVALQDAGYIQGATERAFQVLVEGAIEGVEEHGLSPFEAADRVAAQYDYVAVESVLTEVRTRLGRPERTDTEMDAPEDVAIDPEDLVRLFHQTDKAIVRGCIWMLIDELFGNLAADEFESDLLAHAESSDKSNKVEKVDN